MRILVTTAAVLAAIPCLVAYANPTTQQDNPAAQPRTDSASPPTQPQRGMRTGSNHQEEAIDAEDFVDTATAKGIAEIETARLALEQGTEHIRDFANTMIEDHTQANERLAELARQKNLEVADNATLMDRAQRMILQLSDGESFDEAYLDNQVEAHEDTIALFQRASNSSLDDLSEFADETLPTLESHLEMATELRAELKNGSGSN